MNTDPNDPIGSDDKKSEADDYWRKVNKILDTSWPFNLLRVAPQKFMITHNIQHKEGERVSIEQCLRAKIAETQGWEPYFTIHPDGDMMDAECAQIPTLEELLTTPKNLATALMFLIRSLDSPFYIDGTEKEPSDPIYQILHKK